MTEENKEENKNMTKTSDLSFLQKLGPRPSFEERKTDYVNIFDFLLYIGI